MVFGGKQRRDKDVVQDKEHGWSFVRSLSWRDHLLCSEDSFVFLVV